MAIEENRLKRGGKLAIHIRAKSIKNNEAEQGTRPV